MSGSIDFPYSFEFCRRILPNRLEVPSKCRERTMAQHDGIELPMPCLSFGGKPNPVHPAASLALHGLCPLESATQVVDPKIE
jgi:hypothetical protein